MRYDDECKCSHTFQIVCVSTDRNTPRFCEKCGEIADRLIGCPPIIGTETSFGIRKSFRDDDTGKEINTWKTWEKAGFRNPLETTKNHTVKEKITENIKKRKNK